jgi:hypothetical protein
MPNGNLIRLKNQYDGKNQIIAKMVLLILDFKHRDRNKKPINNMRK